MLARFSEPSSYAGLGALLALIGWNLPDTIAGQLAQLLAAGCGLLALLLKERGLIRAIVLVFAVLAALAGRGARRPRLGRRALYRGRQDHRGGRSLRPQGLRGIRQGQGGGGRRGRQ